MDPNTPMTPAPVETSQEPVPTKRQGSAIRILGVLGFIVLIVVVNATAVYFGAKKNEAARMLENPIIAPDGTLIQTTEEVPVLQDSTLMGSPAAQEIIETIAPEIVPQLITETPSPNTP